MYHIAYVNSEPGCLWASGQSSLMKFGLDGNIIQTVNDALCWHGSFAVTRDWDLLYVNKDQRIIKKKSEDEAIDFVKIQDHERIRCICTSKITGDLLVVIDDTERRINRVNRYDNAGNSQVIVSDDDRTLFESPSYITENTNGNVVVSDYDRKAVVVFDGAGQHKFNIKKHRIHSEFTPTGICSDGNGQIIVFDANTLYIYVFDQDGHLSLLLDKQPNRVWGLCVDDEQNLYVGNKTGTIDVYRYWDIQI